MPLRLLARAAPFVLGAVAAAIWLRRRQPQRPALPERTGVVPPARPPAAAPAPPDAREAADAGDPSAQRTRRFERASTGRFERAPEGRFERAPEGRFERAPKGRFDRADEPPVDIVMVVDDLLDGAR